MNSEQIIKIISDSLTPKYNASRDAKIAYLINLKGKVLRASELERELKKQLASKVITKENATELLKNAHRDYIHATKIDIALARDFNNEQIKEKTFKSCNAFLLALINRINNQILNANPRGIVLIQDTTYDIEFLLGSEDGNKQFAVNTRKVGGSKVQCLHYRTSSRIRKEVIEWIM